MSTLMSTEAVAAYLGVPVNTVYRWRTTGRGPHAARVGRYLRWRLEDVDDWLSGQVADSAEQSVIKLERYR